MIFLELFWSFVQIGAFSIGGGMAAMPLIQAQTVQVHGWLTMTEFTDLVTIAEMTPGPIAVNAATFVGMRVAGVPGALAATLGCIAPACVIVSLLAWLYFRFQKLAAIQGVLSGLRPAVVALIAGAGLTILLLALWGEAGPAAGLAAVDWVAAGLFLAAFLVLRFLKPSPILVMAACGLIGGVVYTLL